MWVIKLLSVLVVVLSCGASPRWEFEASPRAIPYKGRLAKSVLPTRYDLILRLESNFTTTKTFTGKATITLNVTEEKVSSFQIHSKDLVFKTENVKLTEQGASIPFNVTDDSDENDLRTIRTGNELQVNTDYLLVIDYTGKLSDTSMSGFYLSSYLNSQGKKEYLATTQFEQIDARRAFPGFDEPSFKAPFGITIQFPDGYSVRSNTQGGDPKTDPTTKLQQVTFPDTPKMSTYLVAFLVSKFKCQSSTDGKTEVCAKPGEVESARTNLALATSPKVLTIMKNYTGHDFYDDLKKVTHVGIPDFLVGAMENWGLVTYREAALLFDDKESSNANKQRIVTTIVHELAHQWFGDVVTLNWWADTFLNEGFATYFEYSIVDEIEGYESWELDKQFVVEELQTALVADSSDSVLPLSYNSSDLEIISSRFDDISYNKGGSILRMVQNFLGLDNFKAWLTAYIKTYEGSSSTNADLWNTYDPSKDNTVLPDSTTLSQVMDTWTKSAGYPLITVTSKDTTVTVNQAPFVTSQDAKWYVPITYTLSNGTQGKEWLIPNKAVTLDIKDQEWIVFNNQQTGYYRVDYDKTSLAKISAALAKDVNSIDEISRSQLVDDQFNLAKAGKKTYTEVLEFLTFLKNDDSYYPWVSAFVGFKYMLQRTSNATVQKALTEYVEKIMPNLTSSVSIDKPNSSNQIYTLKQVLAQTWACKLGDETCLKTAKDLFAKYIAAPSQSVDPNLRSIVYCYGLRNSANVSNDFDTLWQNYQTSLIATEKITLLGALGCPDDHATRLKYLATVLLDDIRIQDARYVFSSVASSGPDGVTDILNFLYTNYTGLKARFGDDTSAFPYAISTAADFITSQSQVNLLAKLVQIKDIEASLNTTTTAAIAKASKNLEIQASLEKSLKQYFGMDTNNSAFMNQYQVVNLVLVLLGYLLFNHY